MRFIGDSQALSFFDEGFYLSNNPDVQNAVANGVFETGFEHFLEFGLSEGRAPQSELKFFSENGYLASNPDVQAEVDNEFFASGLDHFLTFGLNNEEVQGRIDNGGTGFDYFDEVFYLSSNPDVEIAFINADFDSGLEHFIQFGFSEGRVPGQSLIFFTEDDYLASNPDVNAAVEDGVFTSGLEHFLQFGVREEGREGTGYEEFFNEEEYLAENPDVAVAVGDGIFETGLEHYISFGFSEGRVLPPSITVVVADVEQPEFETTFEFDVSFEFEESGETANITTSLDFSVLGVGVNATTPFDFAGSVNPSGTVDIVNGMGTVSFEIVDDDLDEVAETFQLAISQPVEFGEDEVLATALGTILEDAADTEVV